ncbi:hypothetical protein [uncultured Serinicoccus sp.]|uniref:hypothetical protein n=1 Tax=uncultured Serinicoccus sp. TaxID=735514 RepID=UPI00262650A1|nr:hypothetical protein [uncultured Serinicoccus sp.]
MRPLHAAEAKAGLRVLYAGKDDSTNVLDPGLLRRGHILKHHHPGLIDMFHGPGLNHCVVRFIGLEEEPVSTVLGFDHRGDGSYIGLLVPTETEWADALRSGWWG